MLDSKRYDIDTSRLHLRQLSIADKTDFFALMRDKKLFSFVSMPPTEKQIEDKFRQRISPWNKNSALWLCLAMIDKVSGAFIGVHGFRPSSQDADSVELGYIIDSQYAGREYATESTAAVLQLATDLKFATAIAYVTAGNDASCHVLTKCGFSYQCDNDSTLEIDSTLSLCLPP